MRRTPRVAAFVLAVLVSTVSADSVEQWDVFQPSLPKE